MILMILYGMCSLILCSVVMCIIWTVVPKSVNRRRRVQWCSVAVVCVMGVSSAPYLRHWYITSRYGDALRASVANAMRSSDLGGSLCAIKVLGVRGGVAEVAALVETERGRFVEVYEFGSVGRFWTFNKSVRVVWSELGNADGNLFPPYPSAHEPRWLQEVFW